MNSGFIQHAPHTVPTRLTGWRAAVKLAAGAPPENQAINVHAALNLLNRCVGTDENALREELISRLADYLAACARLEAGAHTTLSALCELARSYAAMRYLMAEAIEPRFEHTGPDLKLRTEQAAEMAHFVQHAVDSLLSGYTTRVTLDIRQLARWKVELGLTVANVPGQPEFAPRGWTPLASQDGFRWAGRFTAVARPSTRG